MKTALNFAAFYLGWFACALGAAHGWPVAGPLIITILLGGHLFFLSSHPVQEAVLIGSAGVIGTGIDSLLMSSGVYTFTDHPASGLCPVWITSLWMIFASTFDHALSWLRKRYVLASLLGALGGPLSYAAGARLGAVTLPDQATGSVAVLVVIWGTALPSLVWLTERLLEASDTPKAVVSSPLVFLLFGLPLASIS